MAGIDQDWMTGRAGCGRKMPRECKKAYADFWMDTFCMAADMRKRSQDRTIKILKSLLNE